MSSLTSISKEPLLSIPLSEESPSSSSSYNGRSYKSASTDLEKQSSDIKPECQLPCSKTVQGLACTLFSGAAFTAGGFLAGGDKTSEGTACFMVGSPLLILSVLGCLVVCMRRD